MNNWPGPVVASLLFAACVAMGAPAVEPTPKLVPGSTLTITFPDMPPTLYAMYARKDVKAQMSVFIPSNYDPARKHPLLVFLNGWDGGPADNPGVARSLSEEKDFICVSVPLFKVTDPKAPGGEIIMRNADAGYMWPFFKTMMAKLDELVPNIDPRHRIIGGFSNGAHATAGLIDESGGEIARRFCAFLLAEGGGRLQHYDLLKDKQFLMVSSNAKSRPRAQQICDAAKAAGARTTLIFEDVGKHDFPLSAYPAVRAWLRGLAME